MKFLLTILTFKGLIEITALTFGAFVFYPKFVPLNKSNLVLIEVTVDLRYVSAHSEIIAQLSPAFEAQHGDQINMELNINRHFLFADYLLLIASSVNYLRECGVVVRGKFLGLHRESAGYASRVNFF